MILINKMLSMSKVINFIAHITIFNACYFLFKSGGDLEYNENFASIFYQMVKGIDKGILSLSDNENGFKKLSSKLCYNMFYKF